VVANFQNLSNGGIELQTTGENDAYIFYGGNYMKTQWRKDSAKEHYKFLIDGNYIEINNPGFIFHILPNDRKVNIE